MDDIRQPTVKPLHVGEQEHKLVSFAKEWALSFLAELVILAKGQTLSEWAPTHLTQEVAAKAAKASAKHRTEWPKWILTEAELWWVEELKWEETDETYRSVWIRSWESTGWDFMKGRWREILARKRASEASCNTDGLVSWPE